MGFLKCGSKDENAQSEAARRQIAETELESNDASRISAYTFALIVFAISSALFVGLWLILAPLTLLTFVLAALFGFVVANTVHVVPEWERVVVLRLG